MDLVQASEAVPTLFILIRSAAIKSFAGIAGLFAGAWDAPAALYLHRLGLCFK